MMTVSDLKIVHANYYKGHSFKRRYQFNTDLIYGNVCYWQKKGIVIFYFVNKPILQNIASNKLKKLSNGIKVNNLYYELFLQLMQIVERHIGIKQYYQYVFCGHSIGGSLAQLAAFYSMNMTYLDDYNYNVITYGGKPVGNKKFLNYMNSNCDTYRYINHNDKIKRPYGYSVSNDNITFAEGGHQWISYFNNLSNNKGNLITNE